MKRPEAPTSPKQDETKPSNESADASLFRPRSVTIGEADSVMRFQELAQELGNVRRFLQLRAKTLAMEQEVCELASSLPPPLLNRSLLAVNLAALLRDVKDHSTRGAPQHNTLLMTTLVEQRLPDLSWESIASLLDAMMKVNVRTFSDGEQWVAALLCHVTHPPSLSLLKATLDHSGTHFDLQHLLFSQLSSPPLRQRLLTHIAQHAAPKQSLPIDSDAAAAAAAGFASAASGRVTVLSDIDDTLYCQLKDSRFPTGTIYPGVRQFYRELDTGCAPHATPAGHLAFITARPGGYGGHLADRTLLMLASSRLALHTVPCVLPGAASHFVGNARMAAMKLENFRQYRQLYPESYFVFCGDSGQGDIAFGQAMIRDYGPEVPAVFIHDVVPTSPDVKQQLAQGRVFLFDTYVGAASHALRLGLISAAGVQRVVAAARRELSAIKWWKTPQQKEARHAEFARDVAAAVAAPAVAAAAGTPASPETAAAAAAVAPCDVAATTAATKVD